MPMFMYQIAYTSEAWAAQLKNPQNRAENVSRAMCEAIGAKLVGAWYTFGEYDAMVIVDAPSVEGMAAVALAISASGAAKASMTSALMTGAEGVAAMTQAATLTKSYKPPR
jgi:uncharacterized protein with GYD domain